MSTSLCAASLSWHQPEPDAPQESSREHGRRTKVFLDSSRVCCEDEQGTCQTTGGDRWYKAFVTGPQTSHTCKKRADVHHSARTSENWNCNFYKCEQFLFHIAVKVQSLARWFIFKRTFTAKIQPPFKEMSFYSMVFSFSPCHPGDKTHNCENSALAHWTGSWATGGIMLTAKDAETTAVSIHKTKMQLSNSRSLP